MANIELLNHRQHGDLCVNSENLSQMGHRVGSAMVLVNEFEKVQREYPIFFRKDPETGQFYASALLGFSQEENLFIDNDNWGADHIPLVLAKGPFITGFQDQEEDGAVVKKKVIYIDMDHPAVCRGNGEKIFFEDGSGSDYLRNITNTLMQINEGIDVSKAMFQTFAKYNLIEPVNIDVELDNGEKINMNGLYTVNEETVKSLDADTLHDLNQLGYLHKAFSVLNSLENFRHLVKRKNKIIKG